MKNFGSWLKNRQLQEMISQDEFGLENTNSKKELVVLIGPPAIGKSTYIAQKFSPEEVFVVSRDDIVNEIASEFGFTYDDMFMLPPNDSPINELVKGMEKFGLVKQAPPYMRWTKLVYEKVQEANDMINNLLQKRFKDAVDSGLHIVVDMTNMTSNIRRNALKHADNHDFFRRAVVFTMEESDLPELLRRMRERSAKIKQEGGSKTIGEDVINRMITSFEKVSQSEGFDKVDTFNSFSVQ